MGPLAQFVVCVLIVGADKAVTTQKSSLHLACLGLLVPVQARKATQAKVLCDYCPSETGVGAKTLRRNHQGNCPSGS